MEHDSSSSARDPLEWLAAEFLDHRRGGEPISPSGYAAKFPQWAEQIREFFPALEVMEGFKPGPGDRTDSFAGRAEAAGTPRLEQLGEYRILREIGHGGMGIGQPSGNQDNTRNRRSRCAHWSEKPKPFGQNPLRSICNSTRLGQNTDE